MEKQFKVRKPKAKDRAVVVKTYKTGTKEIEILQWPDGHYEAVIYDRVTREAVAAIGDTPKEALALAEEDDEIRPDEEEDGTDEDWH